MSKPRTMLTEQYLSNLCLAGQSWVMMYAARCRLRRLAARRACLMFTVFKWRKRTKESITWRRVARAADNKILLCIIGQWRTATISEIANTRALMARGNDHYKNLLRKKHFQAWIRFMSPAQSKAASRNAEVDRWRRLKCKEILFKRWRDNTRRMVRRRIKSIEVLMFMLPLEFGNSLRQRERAARALAFHRRREQTKAWEAFLSLNTELSDLRRRSKVYAYFPC